jgi:hypothetical protein
MSKGAMGSKAALAEAVRRWGKNAATQGQPGTYRVGRVYGPVFLVKGSGKSWSAAFKDADKRSGMKPSQQVPE